MATCSFKALHKEARQAGIEKLYLHTHPLLPGSVRSWEGQGFRLDTVDDDPARQTTHMSHALYGDRDRSAARHFSSQIGDEILPQWLRRSIYNQSFMYRTTCRYMAKQTGLCRNGYLLGNNRNTKLSGRLCGLATLDRMLCSAATTASTSDEVNVAEGSALHEVQDILDSAVCKPKEEARLGVPGGRCDWESVCRQGLAQTWACGSGRTPERKGARDG
jgi:hypothetical protein